MKCVVCGGLGFIGSHLANVLKMHGNYVRVVDIKPQSECYLPLEVDEILDMTDLRDYEKAAVAVKNMEWVFQLAADMGGMGYLHEYHAQIMRNNAQINMNVLEASRHDKIERIFYSSSACAYPEYRQKSTESVPLKESDAIPAAPDLAYGWEKLFSEILYASYAQDYSMQVRIARFHNVYGPFGTYQGGREKAPAALCRKVAEAEDKTSISVWGDGLATRSYLYITDAVEGILKLMNGSYDKPLNLGTDKAISVDDLVKLIIKIAGKHLRIEHDLTRPEGVRGRNADLSLVKQTLGWYPKVEYAEGLSKLYGWVEEQVKANRPL
jgi:GDP-D-mannose 3',5'-epimerase